MVFMAGHGDFNLSDAIKSKMHERGIATDSYEKISFYVALTDGGVIENSSPDEVINYTGSFRDKRSIFTLTSGCQNVGATSVINIEGTDYSKHITGLNIVVYDMKMKYVASRRDSRCCRIRRGSHHLRGCRSTSLPMLLLRASQTSCPQRRSLTSLLVRP